MYCCHKSHSDSFFMVGEGGVVGGVGFLVGFFWGGGGVLAEVG